MYFDIRCRGRFVQSQGALGRNPGPLCSTVDRVIDRRRISVVEHVAHPGKHRQRGIRHLP